MQRGDIVVLDVEKPAVGGRMLARHLGQVVLVEGAIPGERVSARIERTGKSLAFAETVDVLSASPDRRSAGDIRCGGNVFAQIAYPRQLSLKADIVRDAFTRIARAPIGEGVPILASPESGYRIRARLHASGYRLGFYREGTHEICDAAATGQLSAAANAWIARAGTTLASHDLRDLSSIELTENVEGTELVGHLELQAGSEPEAYRALADGLKGLSVQPADRPDVVVLVGEPSITERIALPGDGPIVSLRRNVRAFFQGNRYLVQTLVAHVLSLVPEGDVLDLYAGVGLFGVSLAARGATHVTMVEGDPVSGSDLQANAEPYEPRVRIERRSVEAFVTRGQGMEAPAACVVDPPRTGVSRDALDALVRLRPSRFVYVSCDVATLARDTRVLLDGGYQLGGLTGLDMFPNTAHVEVVAVFDSR